LIPYTSFLLAILNVFKFGLVSQVGRGQNQEKRRICRTGGFSKAFPAL